MTKLLVAGAGIGGLTAAAALSRAGFEVEVFERAPALAEVGAGITVQSNAIAALRTLGLDHAVIAAGMSLERARVGTPAGKTYFEFALAEVGTGAPSVAIHRAVLQTLLHDAVGADRVHLGRAVTGYRRDGDRAVVLLDGGDEVAGDGVIGADGIHSAIRAQRIGDGEPRYAGYTCWRGLTTHTGPIEPGHAFEIWGRGRRLGGVHIDRERLYWFAPVNAPAGGRDPAGGARDAVLAHYADWPDELRGLIEHTPEDAILRNDIVDRRFAADWGDGPVTLLGDAAHPMTPNMGQGACQAIEDAVILARCLADADDVAAGMRAYERARVARTRWFVNRSWTFGRMAHWQNPVARGIRGALMALTPRSAVVRSARKAQTFPG